jgi:hypothetical protein
MAVKRHARVVLNRKAIDGVSLAIADGTHEVAKAVVREARPPDAAPYGEGLVTTGGTLLYLGGKKLDGWSEGGRQPKKPRAFKTPKAGGIAAIAGFGFPGRFQEFGTVKQAAQPFLAPARDRVIPRAVSILKQAASYRIARLRK